MVRQKVLLGKTIAIFVDFQFEDMEVMYPKIRLEEEGANVMIVGAHAKGTKYSGKHGYPLKSDVCISEVDASSLDAVVLPGGFCPDYMRRSEQMLSMLTTMATAGKPCAAICHGPWMFCSARRVTDGKPVIAGRRATAFAAIKDDVINAGAIWVDDAVVVDGPFITSRTPADLTPFCHAIIDALVA